MRHVTTTLSALVLLSALIGCDDSLDADPIEFVPSPPTPASAAPGDPVPSNSGAVEGDLSTAWDDYLENGPGVYEVDEEARAASLELATAQVGEEGCLVMVERHSVNGAGFSTEHLLRFYDQDGRLLVSELDWEGDGTVDARFAYTYDGDGKPLVYESDCGLDGVADVRFSYFYDAEGRLQTKERDSGADGSVEVLHTNVYDVEGKHTSIETDVDVDATIEWSTVYSYNAAGHVIAEEVIDRVADALFRVKTYGRDSAGRWTEVVSDEDADGAIDERLEATYDADGNRSLVERTDDRDHVDWFAYTYDERDNVLSEEWGGAGRDARWWKTWTYQTTCAPEREIVWPRLQGPGPTKPWCGLCQ